MRLALLLCLVWLPAQRVVAQTSGILREIWFNIPGSVVADLTNNAAYPDNPSAESVLTNVFEAPLNAFDQYGQRMRALITAPMSGNYRFWIASDDAGELYVSTDSTAANRKLVASVSLWTNSREWNKEPNQESGLIPLTAGQRYYIEVVTKEGFGGDNAAVRWQLPNGVMEEPIPASRCQPFGLGAPQITQQPTNVTVVEGGSAVFSVSLARTFGATYQWKRNGTNIPGANSSSVILSPVVIGDSGSTFLCAITNSYGGTNTVTASLTVSPDVTRPTIAAVENLGENSRVTVVFSEAVEASTATNKLNYSLNLSATISSARFAGDDRTVVLETSPLSVGPTYTLTVNNVRDRAATPNTILPNSQRTFSLNFTPLDVRYVIGTNEPAGPSSRRTGLAITEIMYHPTNRVDGRVLEFIEIYNSNPWVEDLSGYRISGDAGYTFPAGTSIPARSYRVIAPRPADIAAVYGVPSVLGPLTNSSAGNTTNVLGNGSATIQLRDELDSVLLEVNYEDEAPWPVSPDDAGHSLVLARPSYGEGDPQAWSASDRMGGSPGAAEPSGSNPWRTILINEVLAHTDAPQQDFVELFNYGSAAVNVGNCILTDDPQTNRFVIPAGTTIPAMGRLAYTQSQLGFALDAAGETIYFIASDRSRVVDALRFDAQENGVAFGRYPDGTVEFRRLAQPTPGGVNARPHLSGVVISEIHYHPVTEDDDEEFVEIHNRGTNAVNLSGWRLRGGIDFNFPNGASLAAGGYAVVARSQTNFFLAHPGFNAALVLGEYSGGLGNGGDTVRLTKPDDLVSTNLLGQPVTNKIHIEVDAVAYGTGGRWGPWADGGGSSLERVDLRGHGHLAPNWADSDESAKSGWKTVEFTGVLDLGAMAQADQLQIFLLGAGECLVDNVEVIPQGGANVVVNGDFSANASGWFLQGTHQDSHWQATGGFSGGCLRLVASDRGDTGANRIRTVLSQTLNQGSTATLRARVRWLKGHPEILLRLRGNWLEAPGGILTTRAFGTPGAQNSQHRTNTGPAITSVNHWPVLPADGEAVTVTARIEDPDGLAAATLKYRVDPSTNFIAIPMRNRGAGFYSAEVPGRAAGVQLAFYVEAHDGGTTPVGGRFPSDAPARDCLIRFGEPAGLPMLGSYRLWVAEKNIARWNAREKQSNHPLDMTFVYGDVRVCYNAATLYSGSPWHTPGYGGPLGSVCDYEVNLAKDDLVLGADSMVLATTGNLDSDSSRQAEQAAFWIGRKLGTPYMYRRHVRLFFNGLSRAPLFEDAQQPDREIVSQFFPDDPDGSLHKIEDWFEFDDSGDNKIGDVAATLENFTTTGGLKKTARYRWNWRPRGVRESASDFTNVFTLVDAVNAVQPEPYRSQVASVMNVEEWMRILAMERIAGNWDSYGYNRGKNMYAYKPEQGPWVLLPWDIDFVFNFGGDSPTNGLFGGTEPMMNRLRDFPEFRRAYWRAFEDAVNGPLTASAFNSRVDAIAAGLTDAGAPPDTGGTQGLKDYVAARRAYLVGQLATVATNFAVDGSTTFSTNRNLITISGSAPIGVAVITVNGVPAQPTWTSLTSWRLEVVLQAGLNNLTVAGVNNKGQAIGGASASLNVTFVGTLEPALGNVIFNEIMYNPAVPDSEFVEIRSTATNTAYDLSNWRINGLDCVIPPGTILEPGALLLFGKNSDAFWHFYGNSVSVAGVFNGNFDNGGETIQLIRPGNTPQEDAVIDEVTYDDDAPWPAAADGFGSSLQLIDGAQDNNRVGNWGAVGSGGVLQTNTLITITDVWKYNQSGSDLGVPWRQTNYNDGGWPSGAALLYVETDPLPAPKNTALTIGRRTYYFRKAFNFTGNPASTTLRARFIIDDGAVVYLNGTNVFSLGMPDGNISYSTFADRTVVEADYEGPFTIPAASLVQGTNVIAVEVHQVSAGSSDVVFGMTLEAITSPPEMATPDAPNSIAAALPLIPRLWLNEVQTQNVTGPQDSFGQRDPWLELHNSSAAAIGLTNLYLTDSYTNLTRWAIPAGHTVNAGGFKLVWLDGQLGQNTPGELHAGFALNSPTGSVALVHVFNNRTSVVDYLNYSLPVADRSYGAYPDGTAARRTRFYIPTPGAANTNGHPEVTVSINEWMAGNSSTITDPLDGKFSDWFELHNHGTDEVDLSGFTLTDDLSEPTKWTIPPGFSIGAGQFLLVWADGDIEQNGQGSDLHADFNLGLGGEAIGLYTPNGVEVAAVTFGQQTNNISEGRFPDSAPNRYFMSTPTPRAANFIPGQQNSPPVLGSIGNRSVNEHSLLTFTATATDPNSGQTLTYSLDSGAPAGAAINPESGVFTWTPSEVQGPGVHAITIRVTDNGTTNLSDAETISVTVNEVNAAPALFSIGDRSVDELTTLTFTASASDGDQPANALSFSLDEGAPAGAAIHPDTGVFTWNPTEAQGAGVYSVTIVVSDNGTPSLNAAETISVTVNEANQAPQLAPLSNASLLAGRTLNITNSASDSDLPAQTLAFQLVNPPAGMTIDSVNGWLSWRPPVAQAGTTNTVLVRVSDSGTPSLAATQAFSVIVLAPMTPVLTARSISNGSFHFQVVGDAGPDYVIEGRPALSAANWIPLNTNVAPTPPFNGSVPVFTNDARGFYRVRLVP